MQLDVSGAVTPPRDAVLTAARQQPASLTVDQKLRNGIEGLVAQPVKALVAQHLDNVVSGFKLFEDERPEDPQAANDWDSKLDDAFRESLNTVVPGVLSIGDAERLTVDARLHDIQSRDHITNELTQAIVKGPWTVASACQSVGITEEDRAALVTAPEPAKAAEAPQQIGGTVLPQQRDMIVHVIREWLAAHNSDQIEASWLLGEAGEPDDVIAAGAMSKLGFQSPQASLPVLRAIALSDPNYSLALVEEAVQPPGAAPKRAPRKPKAEAPANAMQAASEAAAEPGKVKVEATRPEVLALIETILSKTELGEKAFAELMGFSRGTLNNIRKLKSAYEPDDKAKRVLADIINDRIDSLTNAGRAAEVVE